MGEFRAELIRNHRALEIHGLKRGVILYEHGADAPVKEDFQRRKSLTLGSEESISDPGVYEEVKRENQSLIS
ncbi:hypothetical protein ACFFSY_10670 [Paenibacillus aurantiacus]|uniref:Uncharacterized protein n=1 Tax=Paenibacillus aurantiacus TaxID=1936118 RepID=A0ABV5KQH6_9BACL